MLVRQKREFLEDVGREWSDVREEGPVLLTTNTVRGSEVLPELREMTRQLRRENVVRCETDFLCHQLNVNITELMGGYL